MSKNKFDAVVVGSGAGGAAAAYALSQAGANTLVLEAGPKYNPREDYSLESNEWEIKGFPFKRGSQVHYSVAPMQALHSEHRTLRSWNHLNGLFHQQSRRQNRGYEHLQAVGGSTLRYTGEAHRLNPKAMKLHSDFSVGADWPLDYQDLEPYYLAAERIIGVAGQDSDPLRPRSGPYPLPPHNMSFASQTLSKGLSNMGLNWTPNPLAALSQPYDGRPPCNQCGQCTLGCSRLDKGSADLTFMAKALANRICELRSECRVVEIKTDKNKLVESVIYADISGALHEIRANKFFLAAGAVETPRLLLNSPSIDNTDGQIGLYFLETLAWASSGLHSENLGSHRGHPSDAICWDFNGPDAIDGVVGGCRFTPVVAESGLAGPAAYANRVVGGWGKKQKQAVREQFGHVLSVGAIGESLPHEKSFVSLDPEIKDHLGLPVAQINSYLDDMAIDRLKFMANKSREILTASGAADPFEESGTYDLFHSTHVFGGCRMGISPATSVVDATQRSHGYRNLHIVDASVFPSTGGGESPALTISALALRAVDLISD